MMQFIKNKLSEKYSIRSGELDLVKTRGGGAGKVLFFAFSGRQKPPFLCVKMSSSENSNNLIESEFNNLKSARNSLPDNFKTTVPRPLELVYIDGHEAGLEEFVSGGQARSDMGSTDLKKVFNWLCQFHKANIVGKKTVSKEFLSETMSKYNLKNKTDNHVLEIWGNRSVEIPIIKQHGDFHFANVFFSQGEIRIIDWANYGRITFPAYDLLFFLKRQKGGFEANKKMMFDYFSYFSIPWEILDPWIKFLSVIEDLEKCLRKK